jgi:glycosyltransferase involved in cell wall biosynthesis
MTFEDGNRKGPLVSVLMSTYNRPQYVSEAIESVLRQNYSNVELILVRDGGKPVRDVASKFDDSRLIFIDRDENRGLPYSFNEAISRAKGEYICYLGDDDIFYPNHVGVLVDALEGQDEYQVAYSDLYKAHCRIMPDGRRIVLAKNVEISRDFDRMVMLQFNHALHVSLIHRRDMFEKIGPYNEKLNVMIDWDLTRRLCFFSDFKHVHKVTGEFYAPVGDCDRISIKRRKNVNEYIYNLLTIRSGRPAKPWDKVDDLSIIVLAERLDSEVEQLLRDIWSHGFYPYQIYLPLPESDLVSLQTVVPNILGICVDEGSSLAERFDAALECCDGEYVAVVPRGFNIKYDEVAWIEKSLWPLINGSDPDEAFEITGSSEKKWAAVFRREQMERARRGRGGLGIRESVTAAGIKVRLPQGEEFPFRFDDLLAGAEEVERQGDFLRASQVYDYIQKHYANELWMETRRANALYYAGKYDEAAVAASGLNERRSTVATLLIEARARRKKAEHSRAIELLRSAEGILEGGQLCA